MLESLSPTVAPLFTLMVSSPSPSKIAFLITALSLTFIVSLPLPAKTLPCIVVYSPSTLILSSPLPLFTLFKISAPFLTVIVSSPVPVETISTLAPSTVISSALSEPKILGFTALLTFTIVVVAGSYPKVSVVSLATTSFLA